MIALPRFVELWTHSQFYHKWVASMLRVGAQPNINATEYSSLPILLPPLPEQRAIAAVLDAIDEAIERTEAVIAATERLRDALLHELLTRGVPGWHSEWRDAPGLGTVPASWEVVRLGEVAEVNPKQGTRRRVLQPHLDLTTLAALEGYHLRMAGSRGCSCWARRRVKGLETYQVRIATSSIMRHAPHASHALLRENASTVLLSRDRKCTSVVSYHHDDGTLRSVQTLNQA